LGFLRHSESIRVSEAGWGFERLGLRGRFDVRGVWDSVADKGVSPIVE
jgi:hypothetical protein